ncbi:MULTISPECIES: FAD:protein FMN transferase [Vibrio]|uniref:FAD:protein FMN transferase n=1 Tax=Vibrio TaxID=662 RepID=UPI000412850C|nr:MULTISPECIES: FAD:protein FMN transferase [Vibrio]EGR4483810.1 FAD:protein FMN transferase [Vibrio cholerae]MCX9529006.1 FAD:protein FMN transferase [Vibrio cholerae]MDA0389732.1 FAD:protein FMN transferase [Vibrio parahaemolyticus]MDA0394212.1 FAD:protein FMN transferase [Vibrio parahaemolyticus]MDA0398834.1 FAD:protein FMN transferase [Vibrio parahaemolyticus]
MSKLGWIVVGLVFLSGCESASPKVEKLSGMAQGTTWHVSYWSQETVDSNKLDAELEVVLAEIDKEMSNYRPDSTISAFNSGASLSGQVGNNITHLIQVAKGVSQQSRGCYDLTIRPLFDLWGFTQNKLSIPSQQELDNVMMSVGMDKIQVDDATMTKASAQVHVDLSSIAQGYSVGRLAEVLKQHQITNYLVEIGGEMVVSGVKPNGEPWKIAIEKPLPGERTLQKVLAFDFPQAIMTSGTYRHYFDQDGQRYTHIIDARTGAPVKHHTVSVTVLHDDPTQADAWSTALLCLGTTQGLEVANKNQIKALFIDELNGELVESRSKHYQSVQKEIEE